MTIAVVAASPFGVLHNIQTGLSQVSQQFQRMPVSEPAPAPATALSPPASLAAPPFVLRTRTWAEHHQAVKCLAQAIYFEAGFQPVEGQRAIAQVVLNRVREKEFPNTVCGVVYEGWKRHTGCQFSFVCDGSLHRRPPTGEELQNAERLARQALNGYVVPAVGTATHYHSDRVEPYWRSELVKIAQIGDHVFYRWPGKAGQPQSLDADRYAGDEVKVARSSPRLAMVG